jgi:hypothetical protein
MDHIEQLITSGAMHRSKIHASTQFGASGMLYVYPEESLTDPGLFGEYGIGMWAHNPLMAATGIAVTKEEIARCLAAGAKDSRDCTFKDAQEAARANQEANPNPDFVQYKRRGGMMSREDFEKVENITISDADRFKVNMLIQAIGYEIPDQEFYDTAAKLIVAFGDEEKNKQAGWVMPETYILLVRM